MKIENPVRLDDDVMSELNTLYKMGELSGNDIDDDLLNQLISLDNE